MRIGVCAGYEKADALKRCGFDYFEYNLVSVHGLSSSEMDEARQTVDKLDFYAEVMGILLPTHMKVVGHNVNLSSVQNYLTVALDRAMQLGCKLVTFGASHSRNLPYDFFDRNLAYNQITSFLRMTADMLDKRGMSLVIEPCPIHENNILTFIPEVYYVMRKVNQPNVWIMADTYTMQFGYERIEGLTVYSDAIKHLHFSAPTRMLPFLEDGYDYTDFFRVVKNMNYDGTISIEAFHGEDFLERAKGAYQLMIKGLGDSYMRGEN